MQHAIGYIQRKGYFYYTIVYKSYSVFFSIDTTYIYVRADVGGPVEISLGGLIVDMGYIFCLYVYENLKNLGRLWNP